MGTQALRLNHHVQTLVQQLRKLPKGSALCIRYEDFEEQGRDVSQFLGQDLETIMNEAFRPRPPHSENDADVHAHAHLFESSALELDRFCNSTGRLSASELLSMVAGRDLTWPLH